MGLGKYNSDKTKAELGVSKNFHYKLPRLIRKVKAGLSAVFEKNTDKVHAGLYTRINETMSQAPWKLKEA